MDTAGTTPKIEAEAQQMLLRLARQALEAAASDRRLPALDAERLPPALRLPGASFVTLTKAGALRGCIGALQATTSLAEDVREHALAAATEDYRFIPVQPDEVGEIEIEVSILTDPQPLAYDRPEDLLRLLRPGLDGVILTSGARRATFLPQVWEKVPDPELFLRMLCEKAGLRPDAWRRGDLQVLTYQVESFHEGSKPLS